MCKNATSGEQEFQRKDRTLNSHENVICNETESNLCIRRFKAQAKYIEGTDRFVAQHPLSNRISTLADGTRYAQTGRLPNRRPQNLIAIH